MQYLILALAAIAIFFLIKCTIMVVKKQRKRYVFYFLLSMILSIFVAWYLMPAKYRQLSPEANVAINIIYTQNDQHLRVEDPQQRAKLFELLNELKYQREFFNGYRAMFAQNAEYVYLTVFDADTNEHIGLHMTLNEDGFAYGAGNCFDTRFAKVLHADNLIGYVQALLNG